MLYALIKKAVRIKVIKNPEVPLYGLISLELEKDFSIRNEEDENNLFCGNCNKTEDN